MSSIISYDITDYDDDVKLRTMLDDGFKLHDIDIRLHDDMTSLSILAETLEYIWDVFHGDCRTVDVSGITSVVSDLKLTYRILADRGLMGGTMHVDISKIQFPSTTRFICDLLDVYGFSYTYEDATFHIASLLGYPLVATLFKSRMSNRVSNHVTTIDEVSDCAPVRPTRPTRPKKPVNDADADKEKPSEVASSDASKSNDESEPTHDATACDADADGFGDFDIDGIPRPTGKHFKRVIPVAQSFHMAGPIIVEEWQKVADEARRIIAEQDAKGAIDGSIKPDTADDDVSDGDNAVDCNGSNDVDDAAAPDGNDENGTGGMGRADDTDVCSNDADSGDANDAATNDEEDEYKKPIRGSMSRTWMPPSESDDLISDLDDYDVDFANMVEVASAFLRVHPLYALEAMLDILCDGDEELIDARRVASHTVSLFALKGKTDLVNVKMLGSRVDNAFALSLIRQIVAYTRKTTLELSDGSKVKPTLLDVFHALVDPQVESMLFVLAPTMTRELRGADRYAPEVSVEPLSGIITQRMVANAEMANRKPH